MQRDIVYRNVMPKIGLEFVFSYTESQLAGLKNQIVGLAWPDNNHRL